MLSVIILPLLIGVRAKQAISTTKRWLNASCRYAFGTPKAPSLCTFLSFCALCRTLLCSRLMNMHVTVRGAKQGRSMVITDGSEPCNDMQIQYDVQCSVQGPLMHFEGVSSCPTLLAAFVPVPSPFAFLLYSPFLALQYIYTSRRSGSVSPFPRPSTLHLSTHPQ